MNLFALIELALLPFSLPQMNGAGGTYDSSKVANGVFVVEAYFYLCPHCTNNAPRVNDFAAQYAGNPRVQVLDVGTDRKDDYYKGWILENKPNHPVLKDPGKSLLGKLGTHSFPSTYVIDCHGNIVKSTVGEWDALTPRYLGQAVDKALLEKCE